MLSDKTLNKFRRRMCGSAEAFERLMSCSLSRTLEEQREELDALGKAVRGNRPRPFAWTHAVFPAANQKAAWAAAGVPVSVLDIPHWSKDILRKLIYLDNTWTNS